MADLRNLLVTSFMVILQTIKDSTCKSVTLNLNLAPEWKAEISRRASDYGNLLLKFGKFNWFLPREYEDTLLFLLNMDDDLLC